MAVSTGESAYEAVPQQMKSLKNWVLWKYVTRVGKKTKIPYQINGNEANVRDPSTWDTFENVYKAKLQNAAYSGIGFVFSANTGMVGVDFDHIRNPITNEWNLDELRDVIKFDSYAEVSPSGEGAHVVCIGSKPVGRCKAGPHEMYGNSRYFTITGNIIPGCCQYVANSQAMIEQMYAKWFGNKQEATTQITCTRKPDSIYVSRNIPASSTALTDDEIISICNNAKNSVKFKKLFNGDYNGYPSQSEADFALCRILAFYSSDPAQVERIMKMSSLSREKWNRPGYLSKTVNNAIRLTGVRYGN